MNTFSLTFAAAISLATTVGAQTPGYSRYTVDAEHRAAPIPTSVWYPASSGSGPVQIGANILFLGEDALQEATPASGRHPLVVVSHGSGGTKDGLSWLGAGLSRAGAMVLMVNHAGSTSGDSIPAQSVFLDRRARDLTAVLDDLLADPDFASHVDPDQIAVLGFSMGGATALHMAGGRIDRDLYRAYCADYGPAAMDCLWLQSDGTQLSDLPASMEDDLRDPRISRMIAVDPAFGHGFTPDSLALVSIPSLLMTLGDTSAGSGWEAVNIGPQGANLVGQLPGADFRLIDDSWHFSFLAECRMLGRLMVWWEDEDPICSNPWGSDRGAVHEEILSEALAFIGIGPQS